MSALTEAIARSFTTREKQPPARSPLRALGRRQLSGAEVLAQSVATTAPAVSMVVLPVTMLTHGRLLSGMITIIAATVLVTLIAFCVSQFTRRMAASGGLHSFVFRGLGTRAALTTGIAMLVKYVGSAVMTLYHGGQAAIALLGFAGVHVDKTFHVIALYLGIALLILGALVRSVRFAALAILVVESCSLLFIVGLMILGRFRKSTSTDRSPHLRPRVVTHRPGCRVRSRRIRERGLLRPRGPSPAGNRHPHSPSHSDHLWIALHLRGLGRLVRAQ